MKLAKLLAEVHGKSLNYRSIDRLVNTDDFERAWEKASEPARDDLVNFIANAAVEPVKKWIRYWNKRAIEELSLRRLREMASRTSLANYSRMTRDQLVEALKRESKDGV